MCITSISSVNNELSNQVCLVMVPQQCEWTNLIPLHCTLGNGEESKFMLCMFYFN